jgi:hypothetical protein
MPHQDGHAQPITHRTTGGGLLTIQIMNELQKCQGKQDERIGTACPVRNNMERLRSREMGSPKARWCQFGQEWLGRSLFSARSLWPVAARIGPVSAQRAKAVAGEDL